MQIKIFSIPTMGGELTMEEMNVFLRSKKVLQVDDRFVEEPQGAYWTFRVKYLDDMETAEKEKKKIDYRQVLDGPTFAKFARLREIRSDLSSQFSIPPYAVFNDEELAGLAKLEEVNVNTMKTIKGIGDKKIEKFGPHFFTKKENETSKKPD